jgi:hypothetical protein
VYIWLKPKKRGGALITEINNIIDNDKGGTANYQIKFDTIIKLSDKCATFIKSDEDIYNNYIKQIINDSNGMLVDKDNFIAATEIKYNNGDYENVVSYNDTDFYKVLNILDIIFARANQVILNFYDNDINNFYKAFLKKWYTIKLTALQSNNMNQICADYKTANSINDIAMVTNNDKITLFGKFGFIPNEDMIKIFNQQLEEEKKQKVVTEKTTEKGTVEVKVTAVNAEILVLTQGVADADTDRQAKNIAYQHIEVPANQLYEDVKRTSVASIATAERSITDAETDLNTKKQDITTENTKKDNLTSMRAIVDNMFMNNKKFSGSDIERKKWSSAETLLKQYTKDKYPDDTSTLDQTNFIKNMYKYVDDGTINTNRTKVNIVNKIRNALDTDITANAATIALLTGEEVNLEAALQAADDNKLVVDKQASDDDAAAKDAYDAAIAATLKEKKDADKLCQDKTDELQVKQQNKTDLEAQITLIDAVITAIVLTPVNVDAIIDAYIADVPNIKTIIDNRRAYIKKYDIAFLDEISSAEYDKFIVNYKTDLKGETSYKYKYIEDNIYKNVKSIPGTSFNLDSDIIIANILKNAEHSIVTFSNNIFTKPTKDTPDIITNFIEQNLQILWAPTHLNYATYLANITGIKNDLVTEDDRHYLYLTEDNDSDILADPSANVRRLGIVGYNKGIVTIDVKRLLTDLGTMLEQLATLNINIFISIYVVIIKFVFDNIFKKENINNKMIYDQFKDPFIECIASYFYFTDQDCVLQLKDIFNKGWVYNVDKIKLNGIKVDINYKLDDLYDSYINNKSNLTEIVDKLQKRLIKILKKDIANTNLIKNKIDSIDDKELSKYFYSLYNSHSISLLNALAFNDVKNKFGIKIELGKDYSYGEAVAKKIDKLYQKSIAEKAAAAKAAADAHDQYLKEQKKKEDEDNAMMKSSYIQDKSPQSQEFSTDCMIVPDDSKQITFISTDVPHGDNDNKMQKSTTLARESMKESVNDSVRESFRETVWDKIEKTSNDESYKDISNVFITWDNAAMGEEFTVYANSHSLDLSKTIYVMEIVDQGKGNKEVLDAQMHVDIANALQKTTEQALKIPVLASDEKTVKERKSEISKKRACRIYKLLPNGTKEIIAWVNTENIRL